MNIIIIGAGPAGLLCGIKLAEKGIECKIIERKKEIGKPLKCAEGISEEGLRLVGDKKIIKNIKKKEIKGSVVIVPSGKKIYFRKKGFLINREKLEKLLAEKFIKLGGRIIKDKIVRIYKGELYSINNRYESDLTIIATGCNFIKGFKHPYTGMIFASEKRIQSKKDSEFLEFYHGEKFRPVYMWKFYHGELMGVGKAYNNKKDFKMLQIFIKGQNPIKTITGKIPFPTNPPQFLYRDRKFFIGDAGGFVHQLTFAGIHGAFISAILCAERIEKFLKTGNHIELEKFNLLLENFPCFSKSLYMARNILYSSTDKELNKIGELMNERDYSDVPYSRAIKNLFKNPLVLKPYLKFLLIKKIYKESENFSF